MLRNGGHLHADLTIVGIVIAKRRLPSIAQTFAIREYRGS